MRTEVSAFRINIGFGVVLFNVVNQDYVSHNRILECKAHILFSIKNHAEIKIIRIRGIDFIKKKSRSVVSLTHHMGKRTYAYDDNLCDCLDLLMSKC